MKEHILQKIKAYLAGPDVFLPDPIEIGRRKKELLLRYDIEGHYPFDNEIPPDEAKDPRQLALAIAKANEDMMSECNVVFANLMPWYGPGADNGTTFEIGFMSARAKHDPKILIIGYYPDGIPAQFSDRIAKEVYDGKVKVNDNGSLVSTETGRSLESFGLQDNLMIVGAIQKTGGKIYGSLEAAAADVKNLLAEKQERQKAQEQPLPKKDKNMLWGYSLAKCSVVGVAAVAVGLVALARQKKHF